VSAEERHQEVERLAVTPQEVRTQAEALEALAGTGWGAPREWGAEELAAIRAALHALHRTEEELVRTLAERQHVEQFLERLP
jgi:hypothetical protein